MGPSDSQQPRGDSAVTAPARREPRTVLLVEDNEDNRIVYEAYLTHIGYSVLTAETAEVGLVVARERQPGLIIMDVGLPGMDGNAATRLLKADPATCHIPIVVLTAHALATDREAALAAGCDLFLTKPLDPRTLGAELDRFLGGA